MQKIHTNGYLTASFEGSILGTQNSDAYLFSAWKLVDIVILSRISLKSSRPVIKSECMRDSKYGKLKKKKDFLPINTST